MSIAIVITTFNAPERLAGLLDNMKWAGLPDVPIYVFEDPRPEGSPISDVTTQSYREVCKEKKVVTGFYTSPEWICMHGIIDYAMQNTVEDWIIYVPDDIKFSRGGLWQEYAAARAFGRDFVGAIQAPYWNAEDLVTMGVLKSKEIFWNGWIPESIPRNPHWDYFGIPRAYINVNGAGFTLNRRLFEKMKGWPRSTWRLDEWVGYQAWIHGMVCITVPGPPRIHYMGGATDRMPTNLPFHSVEGWIAATGGKTPVDTGEETIRIMNRLPGEDWNSILNFFKAGCSLINGGEAQCA